MADRNRRRSRRRDEEPREFEERVVQINRVAKVVQGGRRFSFGSVVVVGDGKGRVGVGLGKAGEVPESIRKGVEQARRSMIEVPLSGATIPHDIEVKDGGARVMLRPAAPGPHPSTPPATIGGLPARGHPDPPAQQGVAHKPPPRPAAAPAGMVATSWRLWVRRSPPWPIASPRS